MYKEIRFKKLREIAQRIHWKLLPLKCKWLRDFAFKCEHTHTFRFFMPHAVWYYKGQRKEEHGQLYLEGCYLCGKVKVVDDGR